MGRRLFAVSLVAIAMAVLVNTSSAAETKTHEGVVVSASADKLVMTDNDGKNEHSHTIATTTKIMLDGKVAKLADLKKGHFVKVTTSTADGKTSVTAIDARTSKL